MISEEQQESRTRPWVWTIPLSALLHAVLVPLALFVFAAKLVRAPSAQLQPETVVATTSIRIEKRPVPRRAGVPSQPSGRIALQPQPRPRRPNPEAIPDETPTPMPTPTPVPTPKATPVPTAVPTAKQLKVPHKEQSIPLQQQIAVQQQAFQKEVAELHKKSAPLSVATMAPAQPSSYHRSAFDAPGKLSRDTAHAILFPLSHWMEDGLSCYKTRYIAEFSTGATEEGLVPWPVCVPPTDDRFAKFPTGGVPMQIPYPQPGYVLPPNTFLSPFLKLIYTKDQPQQD